MVNPLAFTPGPVTILTTLTYAALLIALVLTHVLVPTAPSHPAHDGVNITEAWRDLQHLASTRHPFNSRENDAVRTWLLERIEDIKKESAAEYKKASTSAEAPAIFVFDDIHTNLTFSSEGIATTAVTTGGISVYFESTNVFVYVRGSQDDQSEWWNKKDGKPSGKGGVLVNAHYDSVSTGFGATDDGVGVVSILQLIKYFSMPGNAPKKGFVALFNNGEEDFLNGARVASQHPIMKLPHSFVNLEGAAAGGRATLFRSTDTEVTRFYKQAEHPFGSVVSADGFKRGLIRSQTDYIIFDGQLGMRGLDIAFYANRARYHTDEDSTTHTSKDSLWHMLSAALATTKGLVADTSSTFEGEAPGKGMVKSGKGSDSVWFDLFGEAFVVFRLHTLFALSVTLLVVAPILLIVTMIILQKQDKLYLFSGAAHIHYSDGSQEFPLNGWRGFVRWYPIVIVPFGAMIALAFLMAKVNPHIAHSSEYAVWSMMLSISLFLAWFTSRVADSWRPSALHRVYSFLWMFLFGWIALILATVVENGDLKMSGVYPVVFYFATVTLTTWISLLELFALPKKTAYVSALQNSTTESSRRGSMSSSAVLGASTSASETANEHEDEDEPTESTSLIRGRPTFANYNRSSESITQSEDSSATLKGYYRYGDEQAWSWALPRWLWLLQLLLFVPTIIIVGQLALLYTTAIHQTSQDGGSVLSFYIGTAFLTMILFMPLTPIIHRFSYHVPTFLLLVFVGTLIYNLVAFPFSAENRLKLYFIQEVDLDTGINHASFGGLTPYVQEAVDSLPSAAGQTLNCVPYPPGDRKKCMWEGLPPKTVDIPNYKDWLSFNVTRSPHQNVAHFSISGANTRSCRLLFDGAVISSFTVANGTTDSRFAPVASTGSREVRLWSRDWNKTWEVDVEWDVSEGKKNGEEGLEGKVSCIWSDVNESGIIPAYDEAMLFSPSWVAVTKAADGLVEGSKKFKI